jgi:hypothetical protein
VQHRSCEDLQINLRNLEIFFLRLRVKCKDGILQVMAPRTIPADHRLLSSIGHCLSTSRTKGGTSMLANHLLPIEAHHYVGELHAPWLGNTLDLVLWGLGDTQLEQ